MPPNVRVLGAIMIYSLRGSAASVIFIAGVATYSCADRSANYKPAKASVSLIDRKCDIIETTTDPDGHKSVRTYNGECKSVDAWDKAKSKRDKTISAKAVVTVSYTAPQDGSFQSAELRFDSRDDEFYDLKAGDEINVLVRNDDLAKITKA
jgi:hypothetical protein